MEDLVKRVGLIYNLVLFIDSKFWILYAIKFILFDAKLFF
jgi:hypothetical protein